MFRHHRHVIGERVLNRRVGDEIDVLMDAPEFDRQLRRRDAIAGFPTGAGDNVLPNDETTKLRAYSSGYLQQAFVARAVKHDVFVHFVGDDIERVIAREFGQRLHVGRAPDRTRRIVRRIDDEQPRARRHRVAHAVPIRQERGRRQRHMRLS